MVDLMNFAGDIDLYSAWGQAVIHGGIRLLNPKERSAAIVFKRAAGVGRIQRITGLRTFIHKYRPHALTSIICRWGAVLRCGSIHFFRWQYRGSTRGPRKNPRNGARSSPKFSSREPVTSRIFHVCP